MDIYGYIWVYFYPCMPIYTHIYPIYPNILSYTFKAYSFYVRDLVPVFSAYIKSMVWIP